MKIKNQSWKTEVVVYNIQTDSISNEVTLILHTRHNYFAITETVRLL